MMIKIVNGICIFIKDIKKKYTSSSIYHQRLSKHPETSVTKVQEWQTSLRFFDTIKIKYFERSRLQIWLWPTRRNFFAPPNVDLWREFFQNLNFWENSLFHLLPFFILEHEKQQFGSFRGREREKMQWTLGFTRQLLQGVLLLCLNCFAKMNSFLTGLLWRLFQTPLST